MKFEGIKVGIGTFQDEDFVLFTKLKKILNEGVASEVVNIRILI